MIDMLAQLERVLESWVRDVRFYVDERNVLVFGECDAIRRDVQKVVVDRILRVDERGVEVLRGSEYFDESVKDAVLRAGVISAVYKAERARWKWNDGLPTIPNAWVRSMLGSMLGGVAGVVGSWLGIFAASVNIPVALAIGAVIGAIGGAMAPDPNVSVGRGQMTQGMFDDVMVSLQVEVERYMSSLVGAGYIAVRYRRGELDDVNVFSGWVRFFSGGERWRFLEDCFVLGALMLKVQRAWSRGAVLNAKIGDEEKHRTMGDAVQLGIAAYKGVDMAGVQGASGVLESNDEVSDARYGVLVGHMDSDDVAYVREVYESLK